MASIFNRLNKFQAKAVKQIGFAFSKGVSENVFITRWF